MINRLRKNSFCCCYFSVYNLQTAKGGGGGISDKVQDPDAYTLYKNIGSLRPELASYLEGSVLKMVNFDVTDSLYP